MLDHESSSKGFGQGCSEISLLLLPIAKKLLESLKEESLANVTKTFWVTTSSCRFRPVNRDLADLSFCEFLPSG